MPEIMSEDLPERVSQDAVARMPDRMPKRVRRYARQKQTECQKIPTLFSYCREGGPQKSKLHFRVKNVSYPPQAPSKQVGRGGTKM